MNRPDAEPEHADEQTSSTDQRAARLLQIAHDLSVELHPHLHSSLKVRLDSDLDRDLGFDSLSRAELMLRIGRAFGVHLPDRVVGEADTPGDLLHALTAAGIREVASPGTATLTAPKLDTDAVPIAASTLIEVMQAHVLAHPDRPHVVLQAGESQETAITYAALDQAARAVAFGLQAKGLEAGERVAIMLPTSAAFFHAFMGVLYAGGIPVPIYPPFRKSQVEDHLRRQAGILRNAAVSILIIDAEMSQAGTLLYGLAETLRLVVTVEALNGLGELADPAPAMSDTTALIQYTSGSTGDPKGVVLSHGNLLANIRAMGEAIGAGPADVFVSWLPLYHDMGLIGAWLSCLHFAVPTVIMSPLSFLANPRRWLRTIGQHRATLSVAPNFAFELCLKAVKDEEIGAFTKDGVV